MKLLLISDIHLGAKNNNEKFLENSKKYFMTDVCDVIEKESIDVLFILGDLFDNRLSINVLVKHTALEILNHILNKFPNVQIKILCGNHDLYYKNTLEVSSLNIFKQFNPRVEVINKIKQFDFDGCSTVAVPWLVEGSKNEIAFKKIVNEWKTKQRKMFSLCLGHFHVNGFEIVKGVIENKGLSQKDFEAFDTVFSGHFHIRNKIENIQYLGCPYEITWNDWKNRKGLTVFNTKTKESTFYENTSSPKHIELKLSVLEETVDIEELAKNNFIKLIIDKEIDSDKKLEILTKIENKAVDFSLLDQTTVHIEESGEEIDIESISSPVDCIHKYCDEIKIPEDIDVNELKLFMKELHQRVIRDESA